MVALLIRLTHALGRPELSKSPPVVGGGVVVVVVCSGVHYAMP